MIKTRNLRSLLTFIIITAILFVGFILSKSNIVQPTSAQTPSEEKPSTPPSEEKPSTPPSEEKPSTPPSEEKPSTPPSEEKPSTPPSEEKPSTPPPPPGVLGLTPNKPIIGTPYKFTLSFQSGTHQSAHNLVYHLKFNLDSSSKIIRVDKGTFDRSSNTADTVNFYINSFKKGQSKWGLVILSPANLKKNAELTIQPSLTVNGVTRTSNEIDPPFGTSLDIASTIVNLASSIFDLSSKIYDKTTPCIAIDVNSGSSSSVYSVKMNNCSNHPEHVILRALPVQAVPSFSSSELDVPSNQIEISQITFQTPAAITEQNPVSVLANVVINIFGQYYNVAISSGGAAPNPASSAPVAPHSVPKNECLLMITGHCIIPKL